MAVVAEPPMLVTVKTCNMPCEFCEAWPKSRPVGETTRFPGVTPVPFNVTTGGVPPGDALTLRLPVRRTALVGRNVTSTSQSVLGAIAVVQRFADNMKSVPMTVIDGTPLGTSPVFVMVKVAASLVVLRTTEPKPNDSGETTRVAGVCPVPLIEEDAVPPVDAVAAKVAPVSPRLLGVNRNVTVQLLPLIPIGARIWPLQPSMPLSITN